MIKTCPVCQGRVIGGIVEWHRNTAYCDDESNYLTCCFTCITLDDEYYEEMWKEYYLSQVGGSYIYYKRDFTEKNYVPTIQVRPTLVQFRGKRLRRKVLRAAIRNLL